jgi:glycosyltransferase involved in cell wall biosynthesis
MSTELKGGVGRECPLPNDAQPKVSVIIPTFNRGWIIREAIDSVLLQNYPHVELIVVDDGSSDNTAAILSSYGEQLQTIRQPNQGVSAARNSGIRSASGDFIAFLDSDDTWLKQKISTQLLFFKKNPEALICQTEEIWIRNGRRVNKKKIHQKPSGDIFEPSLNLCLVSPSAVMMRRAFFDQAGLFDETLPACEDYDLWLRASAFLPIYLIETPLTVKRGGHPDQLSKAWGLDIHRIQSLKKIIDGGRLSPDQQGLAISVMKKKAEIFVNGCLKRGKVKEAEKVAAMVKVY